MAKCQWAPACREPVAGVEFCPRHGAIILPLFAVPQQTPRGASRATRTAREASLHRLDRDRAEVLAHFVAAADEPVKLDASSDALQRAVVVAAESGWIVARGQSYERGSVAIGTVPGRRATAASPAERADLVSRTVDMIVSYLERTDHAPLKTEIMADLNLTHARMHAAVAAGRAEGRFYARRGRPGYRLGSPPEDAP